MSQSWRILELKGLKPLFVYFIWGFYFPVSACLPGRTLTSAVGSRCAPLTLLRSVPFTSLSSPLGPQISWGSSFRFLLAASEFFTRGVSGAGAVTRPLSLCAWLHLTLWPRGASTVHLRVQWSLCGFTFCSKAEGPMVLSLCSVLQFTVSCDTSEKRDWSSRRIWEPVSPEAKPSTFKKFQFTAKYTGHFSKRERTNAD